MIVFIFTTQILHQLTIHKILNITFNISIEGYDRKSVDLNLRYPFFLPVYSSRFSSLQFNLRLIFKIFSWWYILHHFSTVGRALRLGRGGRGRGRGHGAEVVKGVNKHQIVIVHLIIGAHSSKQRWILSILLKVFRNFFSFSHIVLIIPPMV